MRRTLGAAAFIVAALFLIGANSAEPIPKPAPLIKDGAWADSLKTHPHILGPKAHLQSLAKSNPNAYNEIKRDNSLLAAGVVATVEGVNKQAAEPFIKDALAEVAKGPTNKHQDTWLDMEKVARTYDFFYEHITPADRAKMLTWLNAELSAFTQDEGAFHNSTMSKIHCYLEVAYATWGENPKAIEFRNYAIQKLYENRLVPVLKEYGNGGGYTECGWYTRGCLFNLVRGLEMARRFEKYDGFQKAPAFFYQRMAYEMLDAYPGIDKKWGTERYAEEGDGSYLYSIAQEYPRLTRNILAAYFRGSQLAGFIAAKDRRGSNAATRMHDFLWDEKPEAASDIRTFPLAHAALNIGKVYARGDWSDDATWLRFECGNPFTQHQHWEAGNFEIFRREPLATESGQYPDGNWGDPHAVNWYIRTVAHNCILVYMPGEQFTCARANGPLANDGGQMGSIRYVDDLATWRAIPTNERGQLIAYDNQPNFLYVAGDASRAYNRAKATQCIRQILFIRPHTFVMLDRVTSTRPDYQKTWLLHSLSEPKVENGGFIVTEGRGQLVVQTLLPEKAKIASIHGYGYHGQTFDPPKGSQNGADASWRVEVTPAAPANTDLFLHVLQTEDTPVKATLVKKNNMVGASAANWEVLFDDKGNGTVTIAGKATPIKLGLKPGKFE